jgi:hypothetical protein
MIILSLIKELRRWVVFTFYKQAAIARWKVTGKRHWVLQVKGTWRMAVMNNDEIREYNRRAKKGHFLPLDIPTLLKNALYGTPAGNTGERKRK